MTKSEMTHFGHHWSFVSMPFAKEGKIMIKILFKIKDYNAKDLVRTVSQQRLDIGLVCKLLQKLRIAVYWPSSWQQHTMQHTHS